MLGRRGRQGRSKAEVWAQAEEKSLLLTQSWQARLAGSTPEPKPTCLQADFAETAGPARETRPPHAAVGAGNSSETACWHL